MENIKQYYYFIFIFGVFGEAVGSSSAVVKDLHLYCNLDFTGFHTHTSPNSCSTLDQAQFLIGSCSEFPKGNFPKEWINHGLIRWHTINYYHEWWVCPAMDCLQQGWPTLFPMSPCHSWQHDNITEVRHYAAMMIRDSKSTAVLKYQSRVQLSQNHIVKMRH